MKNNINKLVAFAIGISVMGGSALPALAVDTTATTTSTAQSSSNVIYAESQNQVNQKTILTLEEAIQGAINNSDQLALYEKKINYQNKIYDVNEEYDENNDIDGDQEDFNEETRELNLKKLKQDKDFYLDKLEQNVTTAYNNIVTNQLKIDKAKGNLEVKTKELDNTKLKNKLGLETSTSLQGKEIEIEKLQNQIKSSENALKDQETNFKVLTGKDVTNYSLEKDIKYEKLEIDGSVDEYLDNVIDKYLKYSEQLVELNKDYYNDKDNYVSLSSTSSIKFQISDLTTDKIEEYKDAAESADIPSKSDYDMTTGSGYDEYSSAIDAYEAKVSVYTTALATRLVYLNTKLGVYESETSLNETKKQFKEQLRTLYTTLLTTEDNIVMLRKDIELNNKQLSQAKLKLDLGLITKAEYNTLVLNNDDLDIQLRTTVDSYNAIKEKIQKPWIAFSQS